jgi:hypothetical protein
VVGWRARSALNLEILRRCFAPIRNFFISDPLLRLDNPARSRAEM